MNTGSYIEVPLPESLAGTSFRIAFQNDGNDQYVMFLDNITVTGTLSNSEFLANKFNLYPNPSNSIVNISSDDAILIDKVEITDINGRIVKSFNADATSSTSINVSDLNAGVYFLNISSAEGLAVKKLIKN
ncbi:MAG: T9SS type A sorting domain-containing protein [Flavobacterium sp.]